MSQIGALVSRRSVLGLAAASAAGTLLPGCVGQDIQAADEGINVLPSSSHAAAIAKARESAWKVIGSGKGSGVSVAIMARGEFVYSETMGVADRALNLVVDRHARRACGAIPPGFHHEGRALSRHHRSHAAQSFIRCAGINLLRWIRAR